MDEIARTGPGGIFYPQGAQRLPNGNTFIVCRNQLSECTRDGKDVYVIPRPNNDILTAAKLRNNEIVVVSALGTVSAWTRPASS